MSGLPLALKWTGLVQISPQVPNGNGFFAILALLCPSAAVVDFDPTHDQRLRRRRKAMAAGAEASFAL
jgi:hypothetical protein